MDANGTGPTSSGQAPDSGVDSNPQDQSQDQIQALIFNLLVHPPITFFDRYKTLSRLNIAEFLGLTVLEVSKVFESQNFIDDLYRDNLSHLHIYRGAIDQALIETAQWKGPKGAADRKLYYQMIGSLEGKAKKPEGKGQSALSRQEKEKVVMAYFDKFSKNLKSKALLDNESKPIPDTNA